MSSSSKVIGKSDDSSKEFIIKSLNGNETHGMDVDSFYFANDTWYLFEFLKCENKYMTPHTSDPKRYAWNWKKFHTLYQMANQLGGKLVLVNYSDRDKDSNLVRVMFVEEIDYEMLNDYRNNPTKYFRKKVPYIKYSNEMKMTFDEFSAWLINLNSNAELPQKDILE